MDAREFRYPAGKRGAQTGLAIFGGVWAALMAAGAVSAERERYTTVLAVLGLVPAAFAVACLRTRSWLGSGIQADGEGLELIRPGGSRRVAWAAIESIRFHRFAVAAAPFFSLGAAGKREATRIYLSIEAVGALLETVALRTPAAKPAVELPVVFARRSWAGAALRLAAALAPVAWLCFFFVRKGVDGMAWALAVTAGICGAFYLGVLYISALQTRIDRERIHVVRRFKGDLDLRFQDIEDIRLGLPFGMAAGGPRILVFPRLGRFFFLEVPVDRCLPLFRLLRTRLDEVPHSGPGARAKRMPSSPRVISPS